ncbi:MULTISPECIES: glycosyltransferase family 4 protein [unclassified Chelatococcus]|uniref:glycosyltransferase family 4 protein n=1 Tax=unclassified Chelatococcus TaxID=2638111 RepID=UPI001BCE55A7|nr:MULTISPECIES: glycosyltransferase family 4 protein [unclassified Chelatococcus]CAH1669184.1 Glycosyltransferase involved in cell wall biosynthesis [Hyphomicrobiales bacterium]MBS7739368.1 glycosyltransferase family 4 protein [Chelatococcus sp. HY11]MBX3546849.1 glycosyltransferase family 4 protein [Chelatococcus sp.]MCO5076097.1 glycosyltransferase family 4 protein [Chelatococcus sp.]CAH1679359.1 Glycosyltransferase involved in cell wall biosynthesis [Hyphomicrobiales bacterium]
MSAIAFYAPLKPPDHPVASGDRRMARLLLKALARAGFAPCVATTLRSFDGAGEPALQRALRDASLVEADRLAGAWRALRPADRPALWFTYHVYYKAPDWIGPRVAAALGIPYVVAEGSRASKRADGPWHLGHAGAEAALDTAAIVFVMNEADRPALAAMSRPGQQLIALPPFIDTPQAARDRRSRRSEDPCRLLAVAMMRHGDKLASYRLLAQALRQVSDHLPWRLDVVGDGPTRAEVEALFAPFGERITFHGLVNDENRMAGFYANAELLVWPAVNEAYGMIFLEAAVQGCPAIAGAYGGVPGVIRDGESGVLVSPGDASVFSAALSKLLGDPAHRAAMGEAARNFVRSERSLTGAAQILHRSLAPLIANTSETTGIG